MRKVIGNKITNMKVNNEKEKDRKKEWVEDEI